ncbi:MAG: hypothetical protein UT24_C0022G0002 [Candidatus Woesebacteria bacterium GW2011_GWB1_39_12]|uniref:Uncharacterized protein n=1 Tax=Candidatus Woesebacteria bacterium GW2011_GWB1_39_12 TaxID=1618574 RepID=A0A0G0QDV1_9BACT|nr:MAG: hypothetical protein UT24_C0022G0002 [Candidatus Woesebacteria bacterium GW2011_GWB1_39_12]
MKSEKPVPVGLLVLLAFAAVVGLVWYAAASDLALQNFFLPRQEAIRRKTFEESKAYNQGMVQELQNMQWDYTQADEKGKEALRSLILHRTADYDLDKLPENLRTFVEDLREESQHSETN